MSTWNYRVIKHKDKNGEEYFGIHECFYFKRGTKMPKLWTENHIAPMGYTMPELKETLRRMLLACNAPVLVEHGKKLKKDSKRK